MMTDDRASLEGEAIDPERYCVGLIVEEFCEVGKWLGKMLRFGMDTPGKLNGSGAVSGETPRTLIPAELGDLLAAIDFARAHSLVDFVEVDAARSAKLAKLLNPDAKDNLGRPLAPQPAAIARTPEPSARGEDGEAPGHTLPRIRRGEKMQLASSGDRHAALLGGGVQYHHWSENRDRVEGFVDGYNLALEHAFAALATPPPPSAAVLAEREACAAIVKNNAKRWQPGGIRTTYHDGFEAGLLSGCTGSAEEIRARGRVEGVNPCAKIFNHKWLDPECVEIGCKSLLPRRLVQEIAQMPLPDDPHTAAWQLGFCRARKLAAELVQLQLGPECHPTMQTTGND